MALKVFNVWNVELGRNLWTEGLDKNFPQTEREADREPVQTFFIE